MNKLPNSKFAAGRVGLGQYLGVQLDNKLLFREHLEYMVNKCKARIPLLQNLCRNTFGYQFRARKIMFKSSSSRY